LAHIGDSITQHQWKSTINNDPTKCDIAQGGNTNCQQGWRCLLWKKLIDYHVNVDYNGLMTKRRNQERNDRESDICTRNELTFPNRHYGRWGWMTTEGEVTVNGEEMTKSGIAGYLTNWLNTAREDDQCTPTCVTIHLGAFPDLTGCLPRY
jgi:hypothetical protein